MSRLIVVSCIAIVAMVPRVAAAHDFWLYPASHQLPSPGEVSITIQLGQPNDVADLERRPEHITRFEAHGATGVVAVTGVPGKSPAGYLTLPAEGIYSVIYQSGHSVVELEPREFDMYLADEGLADIIADRDKRGEAQRPGRDSFARYAKALVRVGNATDGFDRRIGMPAELVATVDPFVGGVDGLLEFQLWYLDKPRAGARVELFKIEANNITKVVKVTSDREGRIKIPTPGLGRWMVTATLMRRASLPLEGDWESSWASLSFEVVTEGGATKPKRSAYSKPAIAVAVGSYLLLLAGWWFYKRRTRRT